MSRLSSLALVSAVIASGACSLLNAPADVIPGAGGAGGKTTASTTSTTTGTGGAAVTSTTSSATTGTGGTGGGGGSPCTTAADCAASTQPCMQADCSPAGACELVPLPDMTACDDGLFCTTGDACVAGVCKGTPMVCPPADPCNPGSCDEATMACTTGPGDDGAACDDGDPCDQPGACANGACTRGADACGPLATNCVDATCTPTGCVTTNKLDGTFCGQSFCSNGQCAAGHCDIVPVNEGQPCDDGLFCTVDDACVMGHCVGTPNPCPTGNQCVQGTCDEAAKQCFSAPIQDGAPCDTGAACTAGAVCSNHQCTGGGAPSVYFVETFKMPHPGWTLGEQWQIGMAMQSFEPTPGYEDPGFDYTGEGMLAGVNIGGLVDISSLHPLYYLTSPVVSTGSAGPLYLTFYRWLNSDYQPYMQDTVEVSGDGGATWTVVWQNPVDTPITDDAWTFESIDVTAYKGPTTQVRWGFAIGNLQVYDYSGWNIDYVKLQNAPCPM